MDLIHLLILFVICLKQKRLPKKHRLRQLPKRPKNVVAVAAVELVNKQKKCFF